MSDKHDAFVRIRDSRLPKATKAIGLLGNLAGSGYECSTEESRALVEELQAAVDAVASKFGIASGGATHGLILGGSDGHVLVVDLSEPSVLHILHLLDKLQNQTSRDQIKAYLED